MNIHEAAGVSLVPAKSRNLPNRVLRAFDNAKHLQGLKRGVKDTLAELCRFVPQNRPFDTIFAHKETIAQRIGMSERTLYRHLETLQLAELIAVEDQERKSHNGRFSVARIRLTRKAAALLGFIEASEELLLMSKDDRLDIGQTCPAIKASNQAKEAENKSTEPVIHSPPSAKMSAGYTLSVPTISKNHPPQRIENGLPIDLTWLTGNGLSRAGVFKLMGLAKAHAKRLSDIVITMHEKLLDMKGGRLFAYLAKLAAGPTDFSVTATAERKRLESGKEERAMASKIAVFRERFKNVCLTNPQQTRLYAIDANTRFVQIFGGPYPSSAPMNDLKEWIHGVESGKLVFATLAAEQRFRN